MMKNATCPVCDRLIDFQSLPAWAGDENQVFAFHYDRRTGAECRASRRSLEYARSVRSRIDENTGQADHA